MTTLQPLPQKAAIATIHGVTVWAFNDEATRAYGEACAAAERDRLERAVAELHMSQTLNHQEYPRAWHDGIDAALAAIRSAE